jgi:two-component system, NarL family, response regulator NreC
MSKGDGKIQVVLADDHRMLREPLQLLLERGGECEVVGEAGSGEEAVALTAKLHPQVTILDIGMPGMGGIAAAHRIAKVSPASKVLMLSQYDDEEYVIETLTEAGAAGYLLKTDAPEELLNAVRAVHAGKSYLSPSIAPILLGRITRPRMAKQGNKFTLTRREREVLKLIGDGATSKDIALKLDISPKTAQVHRDNLKQKLNLRSTAEMVRYAIKHKIVKLD